MNLTSEEKAEMRSQKRKDIKNTAIELIKAWLSGGHTVGTIDVDYFFKVAQDIHDKDE